LTGSGDRTAKLWARSDTEAVTLNGHTDYVRYASFSPDGSRVVTGSLDGTAKVWDANTGSELLTLKGHANTVSLASFSPDGSRILTLGPEDPLRVWDANSGALILTLEQEGYGSSGWASFSPDGSRVVTWSGPNVKEWDARTGALLLVHGGQRFRAPSSISPDGSRGVSWDDMRGDHTAKVWDLRKRAVVFTLEGHTDWVTSASFSPDGLRIVTASRDKTAKVWDAVSGALVLSLEGHTESVESVSFSPDGSRIVTAGGRDKTARIWNASSVVPETATLRGSSASNKRPDDDRTSKAVPRVAPPLP
jgi:WD40 repeat protein